ncbi:hypothetical protein AB4238_11235 [Shewanella sp. 10N.286.45.A1]|uniref:hypothetical protein n=1 Tax=Shewanella sp. 10N.286.45.A1 TaxID=3229694 RepID=UPI00354B3E63
MIKEFEQKDGKKLQLTESTIEHIIKGNFVVRPMQSKEHMTVLSGGLHTYDAWVEFKKGYEDELEHLHFFNSAQHTFWYYARELGNGVITLRLPKELFSGKAAKITMYPDEYYKSGYLWKTLFPKGYGREKIISLVGEALENEDVGQRKKGQIVGYINNYDPLLKMKVVILHRGKEIKSVYPAWTQPNSGNNGKPYSHYENIGFVIAQSTEYFNDRDKIKSPIIFNFAGRAIEPEELHLYTPDIFTQRVNPKPKDSLSEWKLARRTELKSHQLTSQENDLVFSYLNDFSLIKYCPEITSGVYTYALEEVLTNSQFNNAFMIIQNIIDGLHYLFVNKQYDRLIVTIDFLLKNMVSHTLFDLMSKKRLLSAMINIVVESNIPQLSYKFLLALAYSPVRREAYIEYNIDSLNKKKLKPHLPLEQFPNDFVMVKNPALDIKIEFDDFIEILKEALGETYTLNFKEDELDNLLRDVVSNQEPNFTNLVENSLKFFSREDFTSLSHVIEDMLKQASQYENRDMEELSTAVGIILRDYCRIQVAHRQRINARYIDYHEYANDMYLPLDAELLFGTILKHERWTNSQNLEVFTKGVINFSEQTNNHQLKNDAENFRRNIGKDKPPLPERIGGR